MQKKILILSGLIAIVGLTALQAGAHSTIYTDDIGRMHFLGKDPGAKTLQQVEDYDNPEQMDVNDAVYKGYQNSDSYETNVNSTNSTGSTKGSFTSTKGTMDASNPYVYGGTYLQDGTYSSTDSSEDLSKKRFWQIW